MGDCQPFAIMRLTHESIRAGLNETEELLTSEGSSFEDLKAKYQEVKRVIQLHAKQEEDVFYVELGKKMEGVTTSFSEEHHEEFATFDKLDRLAESPDEEGRSDFKQLVGDWIADHREHLVHEEKGLMKLLPEAFTYVESVGVVRSIIAHDLPEFEDFQLPWVYARLNPKQREAYKGMLKFCSPEGKFDDFQKVLPN